MNSVATHPLSISRFLISISIIQRYSGQPGTTRLQSTDDQSLSRTIAKFYSQQKFNESA
jgi:hypothetical protein